MNGVGGDGKIAWVCWGKHSGDTSIPATEAKIAEPRGFPDVGRWPLSVNTLVYLCMWPLWMACCCAVKVFVQDKFLLLCDHRHAADLSSSLSSLVLGGSVLPESPFHLRQRASCPPPVLTEFSLPPACSPRQLTQESCGQREKEGLKRCKWAMGFLF